jgi:cytidine deaminase
MAEFAGPEMVVAYRGAAGMVEKTMRELLPDCFSL